MSLHIKASPRFVIYKMTSNIKKYSFKEGLPHEFEIIDLSKLFVSSSDMLTKVHRAGFYHILWFEKGVHKHTIDFSECTIHENTLLFVYKDAVQQFHQYEEVKGKAMIFTDDFFCKNEEETSFLKSCTLFNDLKSVSHFHVEESAEVFRQIAGLMEHEFSLPKDEHQSEILRNLLHNFLLQAERINLKQSLQAVKKGTDRDAVVEFKHLLEEMFRTEKQVSHYADQMAITVKKLNQSTSKTVGKTPKQMIDDRVMLEAKRLLVYTHESVKEIGYSIGFDEPTNFVKYFKKHQGCTPLEFRES
ncbi:helix-turn-helix domain-containing protein [Reichenbachiella versicolor]|uniref:helix-turn-helix domain-containing protein n=1 Tax=Reichenbachiella versicolor TaxID=1821036 RepID=UPI001C86C03D|nr:helix-turn-helix domain-containing protein [Reichenbachiella versicolor]